MTDETNALVEGAGTPAPAETNVTTAPVAEPGQQPTEEAKAAEQASVDPQEAEQKKKNRTKEYIQRLQNEVAELRKRVVDPSPQTQPVRDDPEPTLDKFNFNLQEFQRAHSDWAVRRALQERDIAANKAEAERRQADVASSYNQRAAAFAQQHPDFQEAVMQMPYQLPDATIAAIMAHERGPEIAYYLANNDDDAFQVASVRPEMALAAVARIASRLQATPQAPDSQPSKPVSKAPAPVPTVGGRAATDVPPEKMTDEQWFKLRRSQRAS